MGSIAGGVTKGPIELLMQEIAQNIRAAALRWECALQLHPIHHPT